jgi:hypothetical protein
MSPEKKAPKMNRNEQLVAARHVPKGSMVVRSKLSSAVAYLHERDAPDGRIPYAIAYVGNSAKPALNYRYKSIEQRARSVAKWMQGCDASAAYRTDRKAAKAEKMGAAQMVLAVGDVVSSSWGYDQTNVDFYQVVELFGKRGVVIREIGAETVTNNEARYSSDRCKPIKDAFTKDSKPMRKQVNESGSVKVGHHYASKTEWEKTHYFSWGH